MSFHLHYHRILGPFEVLEARSDRRRGRATLLPTVLSALDTLLVASGRSAFRAVTACRQSVASIIRLKWTGVPLVYGC